LAGIRADELGGPVALKILSPDITHKSDVGGVALNLEGASAVQAEAEAIRARVARVAPNAHLDGFVVQEMIRRPGGYELILGMAVDRQFGPALLFGHGGTATEMIGDTALALPPLNLALARELMSRTRIFHQLKGYRDRPPAALDSIALALVQLSQLVCDLDDVIELDINPLLADAEGVVALDVRVRVDGPVHPGRRGGRLSISPYPKELERIASIHGVGDAILRPVRPEDAPAFIRLFEKLTPEDVRMRFFAPMKEMPSPQLARLTQIDYDREMAFVLVSERPTTEILGVSRLAADPDNRRAEFAVTVRSDLKGFGIGTRLLSQLIEYARQRGIEELFGDVLAENDHMIALCRDLRFDLALVPESPSIFRATLRL
jgi:acetyltransferase